MMNNAGWMVGVSDYHGHGGLKGKANRLSQRSYALNGSYLDLPFLHPWSRDTNMCKLKKTKNLH